MKRELTYLSDHNIVLVCTSGRYQLSKEVDTLEQLSRALKDHACSKCLFDLRNSQVVIDTLSAFRRPELYREVGIAQSTKIAIVSEKSPQELKFYEVVCRNRGWGVRLFNDYQEAITWLKGFKEYPPYRRSHPQRHRAG